MSQQERVEIEYFLNKNLSLRQIAAALKRSVSTISDEINKNSVKGKYDARKAQAKSETRRRNSKYQGMKVVKNIDLWNKIDEWLMDDQSPELIEGRLKEQEKNFECVSKNSIRRYVKSVYGRRIEAHRKHRRRRRRGRRKPNLKDRKFIEQRPISSEKRQRAGHAEGDFIVSGKSGQGVILNITDRKLRYKFLERILNPTQGNIIRAAKRIKKRYPEWKTLTTDNDILLKHHKRLEKILEIKIFFCHEGRPWQKGSVEESNMEVRKYLPKGSDISKHSRYRIRKIEDKLNNRFMKCLHHLTPKEALERYRKRKNSRKAVKRWCSD